MGSRATRWGYPEKILKAFVYGGTPLNESNGYITVHMMVLKKFLKNPSSLAASGTNKLPVSSC